MNDMQASPFVSAEAYRIGREDGFKSGVIAGVVGILLVEMVRRSRKKTVKTNRPFTFNKSK